MRTLGTVCAALLLAARVAAAEPAALHYLVDASSSELRWELPATLHTVHGTAPQISGRVDAVPASGGEWTIRGRIAVAAAAMQTGNTSRDKTMRRKILETDAYPEIVFQTTRVVGDLSRFKEGERLTFEVTGDLTVHGKSVSVRLPVDAHVLADRVVLSGAFPLGWKLFGLADPSFGLITVREPMKVLFRITAVPESRKPSPRPPV